MAMFKRLEKTMQYGATHEFTLETASGVFHQAGIQIMGPDTWCPLLAEKAKPTVENTAVFYTRLAGPEGGPTEQLRELLEHSLALISSGGADPVIRVHLHRGEYQALDAAAFQAVVGTGVAVVELND
ncbi:hypothetical protein ACTBD1_004232 [Pseudomonas aeruginosa]|jgi:hypothetical protein|uniref:hypothetical protein n=1 Tax=Pseudomonadaceae TaxID=135621 RepID=UPI001150C953|nr:hypothetical protein [Pseudomonas aeruginosa]EKB4876849.1 hypothetical protein [Pseudomonas aeruginosa]EKE7663728.1 hypothetical protein [Pseudomonas aeruginosa]EKU5978194.1 hypothetical protein [Pseudomonas aeruginosa]EKV0254779.1 hypothetical protein [Pseudomonas aeruginosa]EKV3062532.1 hypothetical protein [Pseudomonas aeruginosa]